MKYKIKVCGLRDAENTKEIAKLPVDYTGFIFYSKSPRFIGADFNAELVKAIPASVKKVGVFVNESLQQIIELGNKYHLDCIQLHGNETREFCLQVKNSGFEVIKAYSVDESFSFEDLQGRQDFCDFFLFDTKTKNYGGSGQKFNWQQLTKYKGNTAFFLSGGIGPKDAKKIKELKHPCLYALDLNSAFEDNPGQKNTKQLHRFLTEIE